MLSRSFVLFSPIDALSFLFVFPFDSAFLIQNFSGKQARLHLSIQKNFVPPLTFRRGAPPVPARYKPLIKILNKVSMLLILSPPFVIKMITSKESGYVHLVSHLLLPIIFELEQRIL